MFNIERNGFTSIQTMTNSIIGDMSGAFDHRVSSKLNRVFPSDFDANVYKATLEFGTEITRKWRLVLDAEYFVSAYYREASEAYLKAYVGTEHQLRNDGSISKVLYIEALPEQPFVPEQGYWQEIGKNASYHPIYEWVKTADAIPYRAYVPEAIKYSGELHVGQYAEDSEMYANQYVPFFSYNVSDEYSFPSETMIDTFAHPMSYALTITDHGVILFIWFEDSDKKGNRFSWFNIQNLVSKTDGTVNTSSKCPVFCLYSTGGGNYPEPPYVYELDIGDIGLPLRLPKIFSVVVRETDVFSPTDPINACIDTKDNKAVINSMSQVALYENESIKALSPQGFNTARYKYKDIMDQILYTSADVLSPWRTVNIVQYGRTYKYKAMHSNLPNNDGMRILILVDIF